MKKKNFYSVQEWLPFSEILNNGIVKLKNSTYVKILKIYPINYNLKSNLEKEAILNSYKLFLKTCDFDFQILVQSNKEDLSKHILKIKEANENEDEYLKEVSNNYINYIQNINHEKKSSCKIFYILINNPIEKNKNNNDDNLEKIIINNLNEKYFKIKECLSRCGNLVTECNEKEEVNFIISSFYQIKK